MTSLNFMIFPPRIEMGLSVIKQYQTDFISGSNVTAQSSPLIMALTLMINKSAVQYRDKIKGYVS